MEAGAKFGIFGGQVGHADADREAGREGAAREFADRAAVGVEHRVVGARGRGFFGAADRGEFQLRAGGFLAGENVAASEGGFLQIAKEPEAGFDRGAIGCEVIAIEREAHFEAERVACAKPAGCGTGGDEFFPERDAIGGRAEELESIFAGVARAANDRSIGEGGDAISLR